MTRARTLKTAVRARMAKTGERYTTARRHVLAAEPVTRPSSPRSSARATAGAASPSAAASEPRGAVSDPRVRERTGHDLAHWFSVLDRFGGTAKGHTALARHLRDAHDVPGWYSQGITVAYERAHGGRSRNQRPDGSFDFGASTIVAAAIAEVQIAMTDPRRRARWTRGLDDDLVAAVTAGMDGRAGRGFAPRSQGQAASRFRWGTSVVEVMLMPLPDGRTRVHVQHGKLPSLAAVESHRPLWKAALAALSAEAAARDAATTPAREPTARRSRR